MIMLETVAIVLYFILAIAAVAGVFLSYFYRPVKIEIMKRHSDDLKELVKRWMNEVPSISQPNEPIFGLPTSFEISVEKEFLFFDLPKHTPPDLDLFEIWDKFKMNMSEYRKKQHELLMDIVEEAANKTGLKLEFSWTKSGISEGFVTAIYKTLFDMARGRRMYHFETLDRLEIKKGSNDYFELWLVGSGLARDRSLEVVEKAKEAYREMLSKLSGSEHERKAKELIERQRMLEEQQTKILRKLNDFVSIPLLPGKCKYIHWSLSGVFGKLRQILKVRKR